MMKTLKKILITNKKRVMISKYKKNLKVESGKVYSYNTHVANLNHVEKQVIQLGYWSVTTQKHVNYVASELGYNLIKN